jgi:hypothetical protein
MDASQKRQRAAADEPKRCGRFFFVYHSAAGTLILPAETRLHLWTAERVADAALDVDLFDGLIEPTH